MIKANELRIGNWCDFGQLGYRKVAKIPLIDVDPYPIPLTPEILEKAGFVKQTQQPNGYQGWVLDDFEIGKGLYGFHYECSNREGIRNECLVYTLSLHQLQNLYFAITGQELKIQL